MTDYVILTDKQQQKLTVITALLKHQLTNKQASKMLGISTRQVQRLKIVFVKSLKGFSPQLAARSLIQ